MFSANLDGPTLPALDDCFYARKGVEMSRAGGFFTVTWNGEPTFQNPPLPFWILAQSFRLFGERDAAARLPSIAMAIGVLLFTYVLGRRLVGERVAVTGVALLLACPLFLNQARRCMLEVPHTFWATATVAVFVWGLDRPRRHLGLALPLAGALLTKSALGLVPLVPIAAASLLVPPWRARWRSPWLWSGVLGGLLLGMSWPLDQAARFGTEAVRAHYLGEIASRATGGFSWRATLTEYPWILLRDFEPIVIPAIAGALVILVRGRHEAREPMLLALWATIPVVLFSLSSARSPRYVFPLLPAWALCAAFLVESRVPLLGSILRRGLVPMALAIAAIVLWVGPEWLGRDANRVFVRERAALQSATPAAPTAIPYLGDRYWSLANPLLYYVERSLEKPAADAATAVDRAVATASRALFCDRTRLGEVDSIGARYRVVVGADQWVLVTVDR